MSDEGNIYSAYAPQLLHHCFPALAVPAVNLKATLTVVAISVLSADQDGLGAGSRRTEIYG